MTPDEVMKKDPGTRAFLYASMFTQLKREAEQYEKAKNGG